jgi:hypothetical protein
MNREIFYKMPKMPKSVQNPLTMKRGLGWHFPAHNLNLNPDIASIKIRRRSNIIYGKRTQNAG